MIMGLVIPIFIQHEGCPRQCLFCNQHSITGSGSSTSVDNSDVATEISAWLTRSPQFQQVEVAFYGGSFTCLDEKKQQDLLEAVQPFRESGKVDSIRLSTRPDCISEQTVELLQSYGVKTVELGVQSLSDAVLERNLRGHTSDDSKRGVAILKAMGLRAGVQLLPGLPLETTSSFLQGVKELVQLQPDLVRLYPALVVKRSGLEKLYTQKQYKPLTMNRAVTLVRRAKELFEQAGIPVIRMGLQPSGELEAELVAGPYHPAFGELVNSRIWFKRLRKRLSLLGRKQHLKVCLSHRDYSTAVGIRKANIHRLTQLGYGERFTLVRENQRERGSVDYVVC